MRRRSISAAAAVLAVALVGAALAIAKLPQYDAPIPYTAGTDAYPVAVADFDGDKRLDVATGNEGDDTVSLLFGKGQPGEFGEGGDIPAGDYPFGIVTGDFAGDKSVDIAVADYEGSKVAILEGNGEGDFGPPDLLPVPEGPYSIAKGNVNGDKFPDLVTANYSDGSFSLLAGRKNGFAGFQAFNVGSGGSVPSSIALGQFDGKGAKDVAVLASGEGVYIFRGRGEGDFRAGKLVDVPGLGDAYGMTTGQFDGRPGRDIFVSSCTDDPTNYLLRAKGPKGVKYKKPKRYNGGSCPYQSTAADVNGDGRTDAVVSSDNGGKVSVFYNSNKGLRKKPKSYPAVSEAYSVATGDFNKDGIQDFAVPDYSNPETAIVLSK